MHAVSNPKCTWGLINSSGVDTPLPRIHFPLNSIFKKWVIPSNVLLNKYLNEIQQEHFIVFHVP